MSRKRSSKTLTWSSGEWKEVGRKQKNRRCVQRRRHMVSVIFVAGVGHDPTKTSGFPYDAISKLRVSARYLSAEINRRKRLYFLIGRDKHFDN